MKRVIKKIHHFTKLELAIEEIVVVVLTCVLFAAVGFAANAFMPVRASIVNCGREDEVPQSCREDQRCCTLLESTGGQGSPFESRTPAVTSDDVVDPESLKTMKEIDVEGGDKRDVE